MGKIPPLLYTIVPPAFLCAIPVALLAIAIIQVKSPVIEKPTFPDALSEHNKQLIIALTDKPDYVNASVIMQEELERLRVALRGQKTGMKNDFAKVLHVSMGIGDESLPNRPEWLPSLLGCFVIFTTLTVITSVYLTETTNDYASRESRRERIPLDSTEIDSILQQRKFRNPHTPLSKTETEERLDMNSRQCRQSCRVDFPLAVAILPILIFTVSILLQALILELFQKGGYSIKVFRLYRRGASLDPMECTTVLDYIILVLAFPTQILFHTFLSRIVSSFNVMFYVFFGKEKDERPLLTGAR